jgi:hypothetical protein
MSSATLKGTGNTRVFAGPSGDAGEGDAGGCVEVAFDLAFSLHDPVVFESSSVATCSVPDAPG